MKLSIVLPGAIRSAPLWPMRRIPVERCFPSTAVLPSAIAILAEKDLEDRAEPGEDAGRGDAADQRGERERGSVLLLSAGEEGNVLVRAERLDRADHREDEHDEAGPDQGAREQAQVRLRGGGGGATPGW